MSERGSNPSDFSAVRSRRGVWHGAVEYERDGYGGYFWGEEGLTWCGARLVDPEYDDHKLTCKRCIHMNGTDEVQR